MLTNIEEQHESFCIWQNPPTSLKKDQLSDVLLNIFSKLNLGDIRHVSRVCHTWKEAADRNDLWEFFYYKVKNKKEDTPDDRLYKERLKLLYFMRQQKILKQTTQSNVQGPGSHINALSNEVFLHIFNLFRPLELTYASLVCKKWNSIAKDNFCWKYFFYQTQNPEESQLSFKDRLRLDHISKWQKKFPNKKIISKMPLSSPLSVSTCHIGKSKVWAVRHEGGWLSSSNCLLSIWDGVQTKKLPEPNIKHMLFLRDGRSKKNSMEDCYFDAHWHFHQFSSRKDFEIYKYSGPIDQNAIFPLYSIFEGSSFLIIDQEPQKRKFFIYRVNVNSKSLESNSIFISFLPDFAPRNPYLGIISKNHYVIANVSHDNHSIILVSINLKKSTTFFWQLEGEGEPLIALTECRIRKVKYLAALTITGKILFWNPHDIDGESNTLLSLKTDSVKYLPRKLDSIREKGVLKRIVRNHSKNGDWLAVLNQNNDQSLSLDIWKPEKHTQQLMDSFAFQADEDLVHFEVHPTSQNKFCIVILTSLGAVHVWHPASKKSLKSTLPGKFDNFTILTKGEELFAITTENNAQPPVTIGYWKLTDNGLPNPAFLKNETAEMSIQFFSDGNGNVFCKSSKGLEHWNFDQ